MSRSTRIAPRPPLWRNITVLRTVGQVVALAGVAFLVFWLYGNLLANLRGLGVTTGFEFLREPTGVNIAGSDFEAGQPLWQALVVGITNTLKLVVVGIPLLTVLGVVVGVARLSPNWLVARAATVYVEVLRNIPPLLIILFAFNAVFLQLPPPARPATPGGVLVVSNLSISYPWLEPGERVGPYLVLVAVALAGAIAVFQWRSQRANLTGEPHHRWVWAGLVFLVPVVVGYLALGTPFRWSVPSVDGRVVEGGQTTLTAFFAVLAALVLYTASHVAEIVRGSILAVPRGQSEAALALALSDFQRLRFVVLPQAFRIALPPVINQYLNFTKNTSLALAVGYAEVTRIAFQAIGNGKPAVQMVALLMLSYLAFSLLISAVLNVVNRRLQLVGQ